MASNICCSKFKHLPNKREIFSIIQDKPYHAAQKDKFILILTCLEKIYGILKIPIVTSCTIRRRLEALCRIFERNRKRPIPNFEQIEIELFHITKCQCYFSGQFSDCKCNDIDRVPAAVIDFYLDQLSRRNYTLECNCPNEHRLRMISEDLSVVLKFEAGTGEAESQDSNCSIDNATEIINASMSTMSLTASSIDDSASTIEEYRPDADDTMQLYPDPKTPVPTSLHDINFAPVCETADRLNLSDAAAALMMNSVLEATALITTECNGLVVTKNYMHDKRQRERNLTWARNLQKRSENIENIQCFSFDGKKNANATIVDNEYGKSKRKRSSIILENIVILEHPQVEPLGFVSVLQGTAKFIFDEIWNFLNPEGKEFRRLIAIGSDGTNVNTGCDAGIITLFEMRLKRNIHRIICLFHLIELCIKYIVVKIDGPLLSEKKLSGPVGKIISAEDFTAGDLAAFKRIPLGELPDGIETSEINFRGDQKLLIDLGNAVDSGHCSLETVSRKMPPLSFCRWSSTAVRILCLYVSERDPSVELYSLAAYIQQVYIPFWLHVKLQPDWNNASKHLFNLLKSSQRVSMMCDNPKLFEITRDVIIQNGFFAHSESIILSMITDVDSEIRRIGYCRILSIRKGRPDSYATLRKFEKPKLCDYNFEAVHYSELLKEDKFVFKPPFTQQISSKKIASLAHSNILFDVPKFACHSQDTERNVALMNSCVNRVSGIENQNAIMSHKYSSRKRNNRITKRQYRTAIAYRKSLKKVEVSGEKARIYSK